MKYLMILMSMMICFACNSNEKKQQNGNEETKAEAKKETQDQQVKVYYFHGHRRCATCKAVGRVSKDVVESNYADNNNVIFLDINIEEEQNEELVNKLELSGSGLLVCMGDKKKDLTGFAFQNALNNPQKLEKKLNETIKAFI